MGKEFGKVIRSFRGVRNISQRGLAKEVGVSPTFMNKVERGECIPGEETIDKIARVLKFNRYQRYELFVLANKIPAEIKKAVLNIDFMAFISDTADTSNP